jgi:hypothetical protein
MSSIRDRIREEVVKTIYDFVGRDKNKETVSELNQAMFVLCSKYPEHLDFISQVLKEGKHGHNRKT